MLRFALLALGFPVWISSEALAASPEGGAWVACDNGLRCVRAPCPSTNALNLETGEVSRLHGADLSGLPTEAQAAAAQEAALWSGTRVALGEIRTRSVAFGGRAEPEITLVVSALGRASTEAEQAACRQAGSRFSPPF